MPEPEPNEYLWVRSGEPDPEIARLEQLLGRYGQRTPVRNLPALETARWWELLFWSRSFRAAAFAGAMALALLVAGPWAVRRMALPGDHCDARCLVGSFRINGHMLTTNGLLRAGGLLETDGSSQAEIRIGLVGRVTVHPNSRMRLVEMRPGRYRMALERGKISARTLAPPFTFVVDTPGPTAYDVGCAFTLETDERGSGQLQVNSGWVQLELDERQVLIPAGAVSLLRPGGALGTPYFEDATESFRSAVALLDFGPQDSSARDAVLTQLLAAARPRDVFTFLELLRTASGDERRRLIDRGIVLLPPPPGVTRAGLIRGDELMIHAWRQQLGIGEPKRWWIHWRDILPE